MDDFAVQVRQIAQYPYKPVADPTDCVLLQQGGPGGPYVFTNPQGLLRAMGGTAGIGFGLLPSPNLVGVAAAFITTPLGLRQGYNWYSDVNGIVRYLQNGVAGLWSFADTQLSFSIAPTGIKDAPLQFSSPLLQLGYDGQMTISQQLQVGRAPGRPNEVVTLDFLAKNSVASFNNRSGVVTLQASDLNQALGLAPSDVLATQAWVNAAICQALNDWLYITPLVFSFNGRVGTITLTDADITSACTAPGAMPRANTPALGDASTRIATTLFVDESVQDLQDWVEAQNFAFEQSLSLYAPLASPVFTGTPQGPTAAPGTSTGELATTAFVMNAVAASVAGVSTFNTRSGNVTLTLTDVENAGGAPLDSPNFTGVPMAPTAAVGTSTAQLATTAFVLNEVGALSTGVTSFNGRTGLVTLSTADVTGAGGAPAASPTFTGIPTAPTAAPGTSTQQLATTAYVMANAGVASFNGRTGAVSLNSADISGAGGAVLASPAFTGAPTAPTAAPATATTQLATTAFVTAAIAASGGVVSFNSRAGAVTLTAADITGAGGKLASPAPQVLVHVFKANGTYTPTSGMVYCVIEVVGGGGNGGGGTSDGTHFICGGGGGSGGYSRKLATAAQIGASQAVTIGGPSAASSVGILCVANGGGAGGGADTATQPAAGAGATPGTGDVALPGNMGGPGMYSASASVNSLNGWGAPSYFGGSPNSLWNGPAVAALANTGAGGSGGNTNQNAAIPGATGGSGLVIITEYVNL